MSKKSAKRKTMDAAGPAAGPGTRQPILIAIALIVLVFAVFGATLGDGFIYFDDDYYVTNNVHVQNGITGDGLAWALTTADYFYWHPVTWISHMLDCELYGLKPAGHHFTNVFIHALTAALVFAAFFSMTGALWRSAILAALFAVHPLRVESVAWIAERKDLLAGFFWFACILAYAYYVRQPSWRRYALVVAGFALGLMSKPVTVTLPFVLLLLDYWPLDRYRTTSPSRLLMEKAPLLALSLASSIVTYIGQKQMGATAVVALGFGARLENAILSYLRYIGKTFWPQPLALLYPFDPHISMTAVLASAVLLAAVTAIVVVWRARQPFLVTGWFWFTGVLVPMIGLIQVGAQAMADRFSYIPSVGLFVMLVWGIWQLLESRAYARTAATVLAALAIPGLAIAAIAQIGYWKDSTTLLRHTVEVTHDNVIALHNLAYSLAAEGRLQEAVPYYRESLRLQPQAAKGQYNLGIALAGLQHPEEAAERFAEAARQWPSYAEAHYSLGATDLQLNRLPQAREELQTALRLGLSVEYMAQAHLRLGAISAMSGDFAPAKAEFMEALRLKPDFPAARESLARVDQTIHH